MTVLRARVLDTPSPGGVVWHDDARVVLDGARIASVAPWSGGACDHDLRDGAVLTAGCVDGHVHAAQARVVGRASGPLLAWLDGVVFPEEQRFADRAYAEAVAGAFVRDLLAAGTTTAMIYGSVHASASDAILAACDAAGLRAIVGPVWMDMASPAALHVPAEAQADAVEALADRWHTPGGRLQVAVVPRFAVSCTPAMLRAAGALAARRALPVTTHLAEQRPECKAACAAHGVDRYLDAYDQAGLLRPGAVFAHSIHLDDDDLVRMASAGAVIAHCPDSNAFLGSGDLRTGAVRAAGVPLVLGTDIAAGRSLRVPRTASYAYDTSLRAGAAVDPATWWWVATAGGAAALGFADVGRVAAGFAADLVLHAVPDTVVDGDTALAALLFDHDRARPVRTWAGGRVAWSA